MGRHLSVAAMENNRRNSLEAKRRRTGSCEVCGALTHYNGRTVNGPSRLCASCARYARYGAFEHGTRQTRLCRCTACRAVRARAERERHRRHDNTCAVCAAPIRDESVHCRSCSGKLKRGRKRAASC